MSNVENHFHLKNIREQKTKNKNNTNNFKLIKVLTKYLIQLKLLINKIVQSLKINFNLPYFQYHSAKIHYLGGLEHMWFVGTTINKLEDLILEFSNKYQPEQS